MVMVSRKENSCLKTLKNSAIFSFTLMLLLLSGCSGPYNSAQTIFDVCQRWTAKEMQIFFDWDDQYYNYENTKGPNVGCIYEDSILKQYFYSNRSIIPRTGKEKSLENGARKV
jgi:hypothetical protein